MWQPFLSANSDKVKISHFPGRKSNFGVGVFLWQLPAANSEVHDFWVQKQRSITLFSLLQGEKGWRSEGWLPSDVYLHSLPPSPPPSICPAQGEAEVEMGEDTQQDESAVLTINGVTRAHAGVYRCTADNGIGRPGSIDVQLVVQCESISVCFQTALRR